MTVSDADFAALQAVVNSLSTELGSDPSGVFNNLRNRLDSLATLLNNYQNQRLIVMGGDLSGNSNDASVIKLNGYPISSVVPQDNFVLTWNDSSGEWEPKVSSTFTAAGDLFGSSSTQKVIGLQGRAVASTAPTNGQVLAWSTGLSSWVPANTGSGTFLAGGDLSGTDSSQQVVGLQNRPMLSTAPTNGQAIVWNGSAWAPDTVAAAVTFAGDLSGNTSTQTVTGIRGFNVLATTPTSTQVLTFDGTNWAPAAAASGFTAGGDLSGSSSSQTVIRIQNTPVVFTAPTAGQVLTYVASTTNAWVPTDPASGFTAGGDLTGSSSSQTVVAIRNIPVSSTPPQDGYALTYNLAGTDLRYRFLDHRTIIPVCAGMFSFSGVDFTVPIVIGQFEIRYDDYPANAVVTLIYNSKKTGTMDSVLEIEEVETATIFTGSGYFIDETYFFEKETPVFPNTPGAYRTFEVRVAPDGVATSTDGFILSNVYVKISY